MNSSKQIIDKEALLDKYRKKDSFENIDLVRFDQAGIDEETPLHLACYAGDIDDLLVILDTDININVRGDIGNTALHEATQKKHEKIILALLKAGADPNLQNDYGDFAIDYLSETDTHLKEILRSAMKEDKTD